MPIARTSYSVNNWCPSIDRCTWSESGTSVGFTLDDWGCLRRVLWNWLEPFLIAHVIHNIHTFCSVGHQIIWYHGDSEFVYSPRTSSFRFPIAKTGRELFTETPNVHVCVDGYFKICELLSKTFEAENRTGRYWLQCFNWFPCVFVCMYGCVYVLCSVICSDGVWPVNETRWLR